MTGKIRDAVIRDVLCREGLLALAVLVNHALKTGFAEMGYRASVLDLCKEYGFENANLETNAEKLIDAIVSLKIVLFDLPMTEPGWTSLSTIIHQIITSGNRTGPTHLYFEFDEPMKNYLLSFCKNGRFNQEAFLDSKYLAPRMLNTH